MKKTRCDKCRFNGHCTFQNQVPKGLVIGNCDWFAIKRCKDCCHNGRCEIQDAPSPDRFTQKEIEEARACEYFEPKLGLAKLSDKNNEAK